MNTVIVFSMIAYTVGSLVSYIMGLRTGFLRGEDNAIDCLVKYKFVKHTVVGDKVMLLPLSHNEGQDD